MKITTGVIEYPEGSALVEAGKTRVLCTVSVENGVPSFLRGEGRGWVTAEYGMLPRSTHTRRPREVGRRDGRSVEIQRLIGRSLRAATNLELLGDRTCTVDCDVIQADGGTRTAAITGSYVALHMAMQRLVDRGDLKAVPLPTSVAAVSVGVVMGEELLDLCYEEDLHADVDFNVVMTGEGKYVEVQGTAEGDPFPRGSLEKLLDLATRGVQGLTHYQRQAIEAIQWS